MHLARNIVKKVLLARLRPRPRNEATSAPPFIAHALARRAEPAAGSGLRSARRHPRGLKPAAVADLRDQERLSAVIGSIAAARRAGR
jgi:hypothetical protein